MQRLLMTAVIVLMTCDGFAILDTSSCKNAKQINYLRADLEIALSQKLIDTNEIKSVERAKSCKAYQFAAEELLKQATERASNQSENIAEQEP